MTCTAAIGWSARNGKKILYQKNKLTRRVVKGNPYYKGIPLARDSVTLLKPPCVMNHPVAYRISNLSIEPGQSK